MKYQTRNFKGLHQTEKLIFSVCKELPYRRVRFPVQVSHRFPLHWRHFGLASTDGVIRPLIHAIRSGTAALWRYVSDVFPEAFPWYHE